MAAKKRAPAKSPTGKRKSSRAPMPGNHPVLLRARETVLERYVSASAVVNRKLEIISLFGPTREYLTQPSGALTTNILAWFAEGMRSKLRLALQSALTRNRSVTVQGLKVRRGSGFQKATATIEPLGAKPDLEGFLLIVFRDEAPAPRRRPAPRSGEEQISLVKQLEAEIKVARDELQAVVQTLREPLLVLDPNLIVLSANTAFLTDFRLQESQVIGRRIFDVGAGEWNIPELRLQLDRLAENGGASADTLIRKMFQSVGERVLNVGARRLDSVDRHLILFAVEDVTHRTELEESRNDVLQRMVDWEEKERHRLALELHDEAGQHVTAFLLGLGALKTSQRDAAGTAVVQQLQDLAEELARRLHGLSLQLRPTALDEHGLERALQSYVEDLSHRHHLDIDFQAIGWWQERLPSHIETVLYRVVQESLTNVLRHASATKVSIVIDQRRDEIRLVVEDNGRGFNPADVSGDPEHLGMRGMRERVQLAGGTFNVETQAGAGTSIFVRIPLSLRERGGSR